MAVDKNILISGMPANISGVMVRQPTLREVFKETGYDIYSIYIYVIGMTAEQFFESHHMQDAYNALPLEVKDKISILQLLLADPAGSCLLVEALSFFILGDVIFDDRAKRIVVKGDASDAVVITDDILRGIRDFVFLAACLKNEDEKPKGFYNKAAKERYEKLLALKGEQNKKQVKKRDPDMELWNLIGAVSAHSQGYTLLNIWDLTVYQLYDQFSRINKQEFLDGYASKWAAWGTEKFDFDDWYKVSSSDNK